MAAFLHHFKAWGENPEKAVRSPQLIQADDIETAAELGYNSLMEFARVGDIGAFVVVGILEVGNGED